MRLDHLLSKEQCRRETGGTHPKVDRGKAEETKPEPARSVERHEKKLFLLAVSFSGSVQESMRCYRRLLYGGLAQLVERLPCKQEVSGSNPLISTIWVASSAG